ncbi:MAG: hypothetical protein DMF24_06350 [Verrucomicrobia bacterium]|nr:MAG: hypothetical protein DMF24_06350 [Verrucomicrobiota bacterium]
MWRRFSTGEFATPRIETLRRAVVITVFAVVWIEAVELCARPESKDWIVLNNCRQIANPANDGDSFHVSVGPNEYIFRLYMVDAPETDEMTPARLVEQAKYFGITVPQAIEVGRAATAFTREILSEAFTVFTHLSDAMGQSKLERFYAFVQTKEGDLGEQLIRNGLARIYGFKAVPPGSISSRVELAKLQQLEDEAKEEKIGAWGVNAGRVNVRTQKPTVFNFFGQENRTPARPAPLMSPFARVSATPPARSTPREEQKSHPKEKTPLGRIDINTATEKELTTLPGIGHVMAARIIAARPFRSADDLKRVNGIGDKKYAQIRPYFQ